FGPPPPLPLPNGLALDGNGIADSACVAPPSPGLGLLEPSPDDVTAFEMCPASWVLGAVGLTKPVYFNLAPGSPTLGLIGATPADILVEFPPGGPPPAVFLPAAALGLVPGDVLDDIDVNP